MVKTEDSKDDIVEIVDINKEKVLEMPVSKLAANDSDSDVLVIDEEDEVPPKPTEQVSRPAKRKRKSTSKGEELPPAKTSRRSSTQNSTKKFEQVENELEAMFADLEQDIEASEIKPKVEDLDDDISEVKEVKKEAKVIKKEVKKEPKDTKESSVKKPKKKESKPSKPRRKSTETKKTKKEQENEKAAKNDNLTEQEKLLQKFKGPFVRVDGTVEDPYWTNVVNNTTDSLERSDEQHPDLDQITRVAGFGYTLTTLSKNYNPKNFDESWVCVFCRQPPHHNGLGDLFGPYYVPTTQWKKLNLPSPQKANKDLASSFILGGSDQAGAKAKRKLQQQKKKVIESASPKKSNQSEVWFHEDCVCWMPTVRLIGAQLLGLSEAIRMSQKAVCSKCHHRGCTLACSTIRCRETVHYTCAQELDWDIDEETMSAKCDKCAS
eukprot:03552.XXX_47366_45913_1 [CDS] Oithona nana genome sequencing.